MAENSFDNLVAGISNDERKSMLNKIGATSQDAMKVDSAKKSAEKNIPIEVRFKRESIFLRFRLWLKSLLKGVPTIELYKSVRVDRISHFTEASFKDMIDCKNELVLDGFYENLLNVKTASDYFSTFLIPVEQNFEDFVAFLAESVIPAVAEEISKDCDPYSMPMSTNPTSELKASYMHKMDDIFEQIGLDKKQEMYYAMKATEWLLEMAKIPYANILGKFSQGENKKYSCKFGSLENDVKALAKIFCNMPEVPFEVAETLFYYNEKNMPSSSDIDDVSKDLGAFHKIFESQFSMLGLFANTVPILNIGKILSDDADWNVSGFGGGEDWFVKYKAQQRSLFEKRWEAWVHDCQKEELRQKFQDSYGFEKFPLLPNRPWSSFSTSFPFKSELTSGFLYWFFENCLSKISEVFKIVMLEGDFAIKDNRIDFTDAYNELLNAQTILNTLNKKLTPSGELGLQFQKLPLIGLKTAQGKGKISILLSAVESDVDLVVAKFGNSCRTISPILKGFFSAAKDKYFGPLNNLMLIRGNENEKFRNSLERAKKSLDTAYDFITRLEPIDTPSMFEL